MARRDATDPREQGLAPNWAFSWPVNRRILYNRASADPAGKPWNPEKPLIDWNGSAWTGIDVPDYVPTSEAGRGVGPFIMLARKASAGCSRATRCAKARSRNTTSRSKARCRICCIRRSPPIPWRACSPDDRADVRHADEVPLCRHHLSPDRAFPLLDQARARSTRSCSRRSSSRSARRWRRRKGIGQGDWVKLSSNRGVVVCKAYVTKRLKPMLVDGKPVHTIGMPIHWGFTGVGTQGLRRQRADPVRRRRQLADAGVQGVPGERRNRRGAGGLRESAMANYQSLDIVRRSASTDDAAEHPRGSAGRQADRRVPLHRLQGVPGRVHGMERSARRRWAFRGQLRQSRRPNAGDLDADALHRMGDRRTAIWSG